MRYETAGAFRMVLEARLNQRAAGAGEDVLRLRRSVAFKRLLVRSFWQAAPGATNSSVPDSDH